MRFIQLADVHLDSHISRSLGLPDDRRSALRQDIRTAFARALELALEARVDLALIPGDLFDYETADSDTARWLIEQFRAVGPLPVFITPGNHDSLRPSSPYFAPPGDSAWPDNVRIFTTPRFESVTLDDIGCSVTGIAHAHRGVTDRALSAPIARPGTAIDILLFHGSRDGYRPSEKETVIPFSDSELLAQRFTYAAMGHYHSYGEIRDERGEIRGTYSGCLQGRGLDETGEKHVLIGEIDDHGRVSLERVEAACRRIVDVRVDVTGLKDTGAVARAAQDAAGRAGVRQCDVACVRLAGTTSPGLELDVPALESCLGCFHARIDASGTQPDYDLEAIRSDSTSASVRSAFVNRMTEMEASAADENERRRLRDAVYYGLYALDGRRLEPRDVD